MNAYTGVRSTRAVVIALAVTVVVPLLMASMLAPIRHAPSGVPPLAVGDTSAADGSTGGEAPCTAAPRTVTSSAYDDVVGVRDELAGCALTGPEEESGSDWVERHAKWQEEYGDIGCRRVPGFTERCPDMVSFPVKPSAGDAGYPALAVNNARGVTIVGSPDGRTIYGVGGETLPGQTKLLVTSFDVSGDIRWSRTYGAELFRIDGGPEGAPAHLIPFQVRVSHDGGRLYMVGRVSGSGARDPLRQFVPYTTAPEGDQDPVVDGWVAAFDTTTGERMWSHRVSDLIGANGVLAVGADKITIGHDGDRLFLAVGIAYYHSAPQDCQSDQETWFLALDAESGAMPWKTAYMAQKPNWPGLHAEVMEVSPDGARLFTQVLLTDKCWNWTQGIATQARDTATGELLWTSDYRYPPESGGRQNTPGGMILSPDGERVFAAAVHRRDDPDGAHVGTFLVLAYRAADGAPLWTREYDATEGTGCAENHVRLETHQSSLAVSPSGKVLYLAGAAGYGEGCTFKGFTPGTAVLAIQTETGSLTWQAFFGGGGLSCQRLFCNLTLAPGPGEQDGASQLFVTGISYSGVSLAPVYALTLAFDATSGKHLWQARYLDTYNDEGTALQPLAALVSADRERLYLLNEEYSRSRDWPFSLQLIGYDIRRAKSGPPADYD